MILVRNDELYTKALTWYCNKHNKIGFILDGGRRHGTAASTKS